VEVPGDTAGREGGDGSPHGGVPPATALGRRRIRAPGWGVAQRFVLLWALFFAVTLGLGYPTLNRYDPASTPGVQDSRYYATLMMDGPSDVPAPWRYRGLIPLMARPIHAAVEGRIGSWDPRWFAFLLINSAFVAAAATLVFALGVQVLAHRPAALVASLLYLLNFNVPNYHLAGLVDSFEAMLMPLLALLLLAELWALFPVLSIVGTAGKESFLPLGVAFAGGWWLTRRGGTREWRRAGLWIGLGAVLGLLTVAAVESLTDGHVVLPWQIEVGREGRPGFVAGLVGSLSHASLLYSFVWLAPLGLLGWRALPLPLARATAAATLVLVVIGAWAEIDTGLPRPLFNVAGPALSIAAAAALLRILRVGAGEAPPPGDLA